jgi:hypothetical protein
MKNLIALCVALAPALSFAQSPQAPQSLPSGAESMRIVVESISGKVQYLRAGQVQRLMKDSELRHGDRVVADVGAVCKLEFQHPTSGAVLSAVIVTGYSDLTMAEAYLQGEQTRTQLDLSQGLIKAGVVRTAVPPTFRVRTPRTVVAVRGTEIAEIEVSDTGDRILMGRIGIAMVHDSIPWFRSVRAGQGTEKQVTEDWRGGRLLRAIENALLESRVVLHGPHRRGGEVVFDRDSFDLVEFPGDNMSGADPGWERLVNSGRVSNNRGCPQCRGGTGGDVLQGRPPRR